MKTTYRIPAPYAEQFLHMADSFVCESPARPERFMEKMKRNRGAVAGFTQKGLDENGLERKNPVIVALGDSVTAGHFETLLPKDPEALRTHFERMLRGDDVLGEITDARLLPCGQAATLLRHEGTRRILREAYEFLTGEHNEEESI